MISTSMKTREYRTRDKLDKITVVLFSLMLFIIGVVALLNYQFVPPSISESLVDTTIYTWAITLIVSSPMTIFGRLTGRLKIESLGSVGIAVGFGIYAIAILSVSMPQAIAVFCFLCTVCAQYAYRAYVINRLDREVNIQHGYSSLS